MCFKDSLSCWKSYINSNNMIFYGDRLFYCHCIPSPRLGLLASASGNKTAYRFKKSWYCYIGNIIKYVIFFFKKLLLFSFLISDEFFAIFDINV